MALNLKFTYRGVEFSADQIRALFPLNQDFYLRLRVTTKNQDWKYLNEVPEVMRLLGIDPDLLPSWGT